VLSHSGYDQITKAAVICRQHRARARAKEWELQLHEVWIEHGREYLQERKDRGLWRAVMGRHEFGEETVQPTRAWSGG
jgi:adenylylsulfate kinase-like enzyme